MNDLVHIHTSSSPAASCKNLVTPFFWFKRTDEQYATCNMKYYINTYTILTLYDWFCEFT